MYSAKTENLQLPQWNTDDYLQPIADLNPAFEKLDKAVSTDHQNISVLQGALNDFAEQTDEKFAAQQVVNEQVQDKLVEHDGAIDGLKEFEANQREWNTSVESNIDELGNNIAELSAALTKEQEDRIRQDEIIDAKATGAAVAAAQAIEDSETAKQSAEEANERAQAAEDFANKAEKEAQRAEVAAETAQSKAEEAATKSTESAAQATAAQRQAEVAAGYAREAKEASEQAVQTATDAATKANEASDKANEASEKAIQAAADAAQSKTDAASALEQSSQAVETAEEAKRIAEEANGKSDTAVSEAGEAKTAAEQAKSDANASAQSATDAKASADKMTEDLNQFKSGYDAQFEDQYEHITRIEDVLKEGEGEVGSRLDNIEGDIANAQAAADEAKTAVGEGPYSAFKVNYEQQSFEVDDNVSTIKEALKTTSDNTKILAESTNSLLQNLGTNYDDLNSKVGSSPYHGSFKFEDANNHEFTGTSVKDAFTSLAEQLNLVLADVKAAIPEDGGDPEGLGTFPVNGQYLTATGLPSNPRRLLNLPNAATGLANFASTLSLMLGDIMTFMGSPLRYLDITETKSYVFTPTNDVSADGKYHGCVFASETAKTKIQTELDKFSECIMIVKFLFSVLGTLEVFITKGYVDTYTTITLHPSRSYVGEFGSDISGGGGLGDIKFRLTVKVNDQGNYNIPELLMSSASVPALATLDRNLGQSINCNYIRGFVIGRYV